jgi:acyl carrier protein
MHSLLTLKGTVDRQADPGEFQAPFVRYNLSRRDQTMTDANEVHARVTKMLVQSLGVEEDDVIPSATLQGDLGAESIDFLDIMFRLEREFRIRIERDELFPDPISPHDEAFTRDGRLTDEGLTALRLRMPYANFRDLEFDRRLNRIDDLFTVELLTNFITWKLRGNGEAQGDVPAPAPHHFPGEPTLSVVSTRVRS